MAELRILGHGLESDKFQSTEDTIPQPPVSKGGSHILPLVGTGTRGKLDNVARSLRVEHAVVIV